MISNGSVTSRAEDLDAAPQWGRDRRRRSTRRVAKASIPWLPTCRRPRHAPRAAIRWSAWIGSMFMVAPAMSRQAWDGGGAVAQRPLPQRRDPRCHASGNPAERQRRTSRSRMRWSCRDRACRLDGHDRIPATNDVPVRVAGAASACRCQKCQPTALTLSACRRPAPSPATSAPSAAGDRAAGSAAAESARHGAASAAAAPTLNQISASVPVSKAVPIGSSSIHGWPPMPAPVAELDRVLGDGLVPGVVVLLAGEPGVGKSTPCFSRWPPRWARNGHTTLYVTGEESAAQVRLRAGRAQMRWPISST